MLKKIALAAVLVVGGGYFLSSDAQAQGSHHRLHDGLEHNGFHRQLEHRDAHRYPMTRRQHGGLHDSLDHDRYHDQLNHRQYHRSYRAPSYSRHSYGGYPSYGGRQSYGSRSHYGGGGFGIGVSPYGFSLRIGR